MKQAFITARIDSTEAAADCAQKSCVPWWSFTKTELATAALQRVAQERFRLDEPFDGRPFTLRQLLQHRAGVPDYGDLPSYHAAVQRREKPWDVAQLLDRAGPGSVSAVYHFSSRIAPRTVAAFAQADSEGVTEYEVARLARA
jgi:CubicO group peptidase (beta-lactamase class C family)